ncbi:MAG: LLM class flavin-dependent oxidoreductase [Chloroflexota bacterium]
MSTQTHPLAVAAMPLENRHEAFLHLAINADKLGYEAIFLPETWAYDMTLILTEIAGKTETLRLGTGISSVWGRSAGIIAMGAATLNTISKGRFMLGLGASTPQLTEGLHDVPYQKPYTQLRQILTQTRALLNGERIPLAAETEARALRLNVADQPDLPIYMAASSVKSIQLAGELCDGWLPFLYPKDRLADGIALMREGAARTENPDRPLQVCPFLPVVVNDDADAARQGAAWFVAFYMTTMGPIYRNVLGRLGFADEVAAVLAANEGQKPAVVPPEAEILLDQLTIYGTPDQVQAQLAPWYEAGATLPILMPQPNLGLEALDLMLNAFKR